MVDEVHVDAASSGPSDMSATMRNTTSSKTANAGSSASTTNMSDFEMMNKRIGHHRSISQLIENIGKRLLVYYVWVVEGILICVLTIVRPIVHFWTNTVFI